MKRVPIRIRFVNIRKGYYCGGFVVLNIMIPYLTNKSSFIYGRCRIGNTLNFLKNTEPDYFKLFGRNYFFEFSQSGNPHKKVMNYFRKKINEFLVVEKLRRGKKVKKITNIINY